MMKYKEELRETASQLAAKGKGLLAVDESTPTIGKRLAGINIENTEEQLSIYEKILTQKLSVRQTEQIVKQFKEGFEKPIKKEIFPIG